MSSPIFSDGDKGGNKTQLSIVVAVVALGAASWFIYTQFRIDVPTAHIAILSKKTGLDIKNGDEVAPGPEYKGVQKEFLTEGRYFRNPFVWDWEVIPQKEIPDGKLGVLVSLTGDDLPYGEFLAQMDENGEATTKGIVPAVLRPGRYKIHPYLYEVEEHEPVTVPAGYKGIVTNLAGKFPEEPNEILVQDEERGVQGKTLDSGTYYVNPYVTRVNLVDCRSQRFNLAEKKDMGFPSKDGFWISLDGIVEFRVNPEQAAEVYVRYNEQENGDDVSEEIIRKVILPNARSFCRLQGSNELGRSFIEGETRTEFQKNFEESMRKAAEPLGIEIIQALITRIKPPEPIAEPVRKREIAKQEELQYQQQILQQESEQKLAIENELIKQKEAMVGAEQEVVKLTTEAMREQEVALTKAEERKGVAEFRLQAAQDEAAAKLAKGKAEADVIRFQNEAEAAGWKRAVEAFSGNGNEYAQYVLFEKMASAYRRVMVNTADSPIMQVFESFTGLSPNSSKEAPVSKTAAGSSEEAGKSTVSDSRSSEASSGSEGTE